MTKTELADFVRFAEEKLEGREQPASLEELLGQWRDHCATAATIEDIRQGLDDFSAGRGETVEAVFHDLRQKLGMLD